MPDTLNPEAVRLVNRALEVLKERKVVHDQCPRCDTFDWTVEPIAIGGIIPIQGVPAQLPGAYFPEQILAIQIVCKNCGYTMFHNLRALGLATETRRY